MAFDVRYYTGALADQLSTSLEMRSIGTVYSTTAKPNKPFPSSLLRHDAHIRTWQASHRSHLHIFRLTLPNRPLKLLILKWLHAEHSPRPRRNKRRISLLLAEPQLRLAIPKVVDRTVLHNTLAPLPILTHAFITTTAHPLASSLERPRRLTMPSVNLINSSVQCGSYTCLGAPPLAARTTLSAATAALRIADRELGFRSS